MKNIFTALTVGAMVLGGSAGAFAATSAMQEAIDVDACGGLKIISARYLETGRLEVTCPASTLSGTGLTATTILAAGAGILLLWVILDDSTTTTTTTTPIGS